MQILYRYYDPANQQHYAEDFNLAEVSWDHAFKHCLDHLPMDHVDYLEFKE